MTMPKVPPPEELKSSEDRLRGWLDNKHPAYAKYHEWIRSRLEQPIPIETRPVGHRLLNQTDREPKQMIWMKAKDALPDSIAFHHCVAAYASDYELLNTSMIPHGLARMGGHRKLTMMASLDHAIWFHKPFRADEWLLFEMDSPTSGDGRGFVNGRIWTRDGTLVASCAQEGVIRYTTPKL